VTTTLAISSSLGTSNITGSRTSSMIARRPRAPVPRSQRLVGDGLDGLLGELQLDAVDLEHLLVLLDEGVARLGEDLHERVGRAGPPS
jgi:hypothetical protein